MFLASRPSNGTGNRLSTFLTGETTDPTLLTQDDGLFTATPAVPRPVAARRASPAPSATSHHRHGHGRPPFSGASLGGLETAESLSKNLAATATGTGTGTETKRLLGSPSPFASVGGDSESGYGRGVGVGVGVVDDAPTPAWAKSAAGKSTFASLILSVKRGDCDSGSGVNDDSETGESGAGAGAGVGGGSGEVASSSSSSSSASVPPPPPPPPPKQFYLHTILRRPPPPFVDPQVPLLLGGSGSSATASASPSSSSERHKRSRRRFRGGGGGGGSSVPVGDYVAPDILLPDDLRESFLENHGRRGGAGSSSSSPASLSASPSSPSFHETKANVALSQQFMTENVTSKSPSSPSPSSSLLQLLAEEIPDSDSCSCSHSCLRLRDDLIRGMRVREEARNPGRRMKQNGLGSGSGSGSGGSESSIVWVPISKELVDEVIREEAEKEKDGEEDEKEEEGEMSEKGPSQTEKADVPNTGEQKVQARGGGRSRRKGEGEVVPLHLRHMSSMYSDESIRDMIGSLGDMVDEKSDLSETQTQTQASTQPTKKTEGEETTENEDDALSQSLKHNADATVLQSFLKFIPAKLAVLRLRRREEKREHVARELLETELKYVGHLRVMREVYVRGLNELPERYGNALFGKVFESMHGLGDSLASALEQVLFLPGGSGKFNRMCLIGKVMKKHAPFLSMYKQYAEQFEHVAAAVRETKKKSGEFLRTIQMLDQDERTSRLGINSYLIMPIQRIPRYRMLLTDLLKATDPEHPDYGDLADSLEELKRIASAVNLAIHEHELANALLTLDDKFLELPSLSVFENGGKELLAKFEVLEGLPMAGERSSPNHHHPRELVVHLFNHLIVFSTAKRGRTEEETRFVVKSELRVEDAALAVPEKGFEGAFRLSSVVKETHEIVHMADPERAREVCKQVLAAIVAASKANSSCLGLGIDFDLTAKGVACGSGLDLSPEDCLVEVASFNLPLVRISSNRNHVVSCRLVKTGPSFLLRCEDDRGRHRIESIDLSPESATGLVPGQQTDVFQLTSNSKAIGLSGVSFSILLQMKSLDFVARSKREYELWTRALRLVLSKPIFYEIRRPQKRRVRTDLDCGNVYSWGENQFQCLGHLLESDHLKLPRVLKRFLCLDVEDFTIGRSCSFATTTDGKVFSWGAGKSGCLGHRVAENHLSPTLIKDLQGTKIKQIAAGEDHTLFLDEGGTLRCCGDGEYGQLGLIDAESGDAVQLQTTPKIVEFFAGKPIRMVDAGSHHSAAVTENFKLYTWGKCGDGQLGVPLETDEEPEFLPEPVHVAINDRVVAAACGSWHTLSLTASGDVYAWGDGTEGQVGVFVARDASGRFLTPIRLTEDIKGSVLPKMKAIAAGSTHSALLSDDGHVYMFGSNLYGQLGVSKKHKTVDRPMKIALEGCQHISLGAYHGLALVENGGSRNVMSWGYGVSGRLGLGETEEDVDRPQRIEMLAKKGVRSVHAGGAMSACIVDAAEIPKDDHEECMTIGCRNKLAKKFVGKTFFRCVHCRGVYCKKCTSRRIRFPICGDAILSEGRVCDDCHDILKVHFQFED